MALEPKLSSLESPGAISLWPRLFGEPDVGFLWWWLGFIVCGGGDGGRYFGFDFS